MLRLLACSLALLSLTGCYAHDSHPGHGSPRGPGHAPGHHHAHPGHDERADHDRDGHGGPGKKCPPGHHMKGWC